MERAGGRLSEQQVAAAIEKATRWRLAVEDQVRAKGGQKAFFPEVFRLASELIETDVKGFCDRAEETFEEIEAYGQEPQLDDDWLGELTGENDNFYFSTDSLVSEPEPLPGKTRGRKALSDEDRDRLAQEVEDAIIDEVGRRDEQQSFEQAIAVAHGENVEDWITRIKQALMESADGKADFWALHKLTRLKPAELFLGLLLGQEHWKLMQQQFYGTLTVEGRV